MGATMLATAQDKSQESLTNCHSLKGTVSIGRNGQAVEKNAILPSTGGEDGSSAAPTVQRDGKSVDVSSNCPQDPNAPKAAKPTG
jgi:hypothetical protein